MKLTTGELIYINEAAKALKQRDFILIGNMMVGLDNIMNMIVYLILDSNFITNYYDGVIINQKELSAFVKTITRESDFEFDSLNNTIVTDCNGTMVLKYNSSITELVCEKIKNTTSITNNLELIPESEISEAALQIYNMKRSDGSIGINHNGYYMTLFPSFLPINKNDKMHVTIFQSYPIHTFVSRFRIKKKKFDVIIFIKYLKI